MALLVTRALEQRTLSPVSRLTELVGGASLNVAVTVADRLGHGGGVTGLEELSVGFSDGSQLRLGFGLSLATVPEFLHRGVAESGGEGELGLETGLLLLALSLGVGGDGSLEGGRLGLLGLGEEGFDVDGGLALLGAHCVSFFLLC